MNDTIDLDCGIALHRIVAWLNEELALPSCEGGWTFSAGNHTCHVTATQLKARKLATVEIERTHLVAEGDPEAFAAFDKLFTLRFISAGG